VAATEDTVTFGYGFSSYEFHIRLLARFCSLHTALALREAEELL